ncbi:hypothetical protein ES702_07034 [subsurface metagenome]
MTNTEIKQVKAVLAAIRTENNTVTKRLASIISLIGSARTSQLEIEVILSEFEKKLSK